MESCMTQALPQLQLKGIALQDCSRICSGIIHNFVNIPADLIPEYTAMLIKSMKYHINPQDFLKLMTYTRSDNESLTLRVLQLISQVLENYLKNTVSIQDFWVFQGENLQIYEQKKQLFSIKDELTITAWIYPSKRRKEFEVIEISDNNRYRIELRVVNETLIVVGKASKGNFLIQSPQKIKYNHWNFIGVSLKGKYLLGTVIIINETPWLCTAIQGSPKIEGTIKSMSIGASLSQNNNFIGKMTSLLIFKKALTDDQIRVLQLNPFFLSKKIIPDEEAGILQILKKSLLFSLNIEENSAILNIPSVIVNCSTEFFSGSTLIDSLRLASSFINLLTQSLNPKIFVMLLDIYTQVFKLRNFREILCDNIIGMISYQVRRFKYTESIHNSYSSLVLAISDLSLQKIAIKYYLLNKGLPKIERSPFISEIVARFKILFKFNEKKILLIAKLMKNFNYRQIYKEMLVFSEELKSADLLAKILSVLYYAEDFAFIEGILEVICERQIVGEIRNLFQFLLFILKNKDSDHAHQRILIILFSYYLIPSESTQNSPTKDQNAKKYHDFLDISKQILEEYTGVNNIIDAILHIQRKSLYFPDKLSRNMLYDQILSKSEYIDENSHIDKLIEIMQQSKEIIYPCIIKSDQFLQFLVNIFEKSESQAGKVIIFIYSNSLKLKSLDKLIALFEKIQTKPGSMIIFSRLLNAFLDTSYLSRPLVISEFIYIMLTMKITQLNSEEFCNNGLKLVNLVVSQSNIFPKSSKHEYNKPGLDKDLPRLLLNLTFKICSVIPSEINKTLKRIMEHPDILYFSRLKSESSDGISYFLYCFGLLTELMFLHKYEAVEFFELYSMKTDIKSKLKYYFSNLKDEELRYCLHIIHRKNISSKANYMIIKNLETITLSIEGSLREIDKTKHSLLSDTIYSEDWIINIHYLISLLIIAPWKKDIEPPPVTLRKEQSRLSFDSSFSSAKSLLEITPVHDLNAKYKAKITKLKTEIKFLFKNYFTYPESSSESIRGSKRCLQNYHDMNHCWSRVKVLNKEIKLDMSSSVLLEGSLMLSRSLLFLKLLGNSSCQSIRLDQPKENQISKDIKRLEKNTMIIECEQIKITGSWLGILTITPKSLRFQCKGNKKNVELYPKSALAFTIQSKTCDYLWTTQSISEIVYRKFLHKNTALEVFLKSGKSYFFNFFSVDSRNILFRLLKEWWKSVKVHESIPTALLCYYSNKWSTGRISTLVYISILNKYSSRSFHDISQYPIFPLLLTSFEGDFLDINNPQIFRDFKYPVAAQTSEQRLALKEKYSYSAEEGYAFHHGSHYSCGAAALHFLVRLEPFTTEFKLLHEGTFDHPDRLFYSFETESKRYFHTDSDSKELVPQLFYLPQCLENVNREIFGVTHNKHKAEEFVVPKWACNYWDFIKKHRKCLECAHVSANIHSWIDLIFGYKQRGVDAIDSFNVFHPVTYDDFFDKLQPDFLPDDLRHINDQIYHFGQSPLVLFQTPHAKRQFTPIPSIFDKMKSAGMHGIIKEKVLLKDLKEVLLIVCHRCFLCIFFCEGSQIKFLRYETMEKRCSTVKLISLSSITTFDFIKITLHLWKNSILSSNYIDESLKLHNFEGEMIRNIVQYASAISAICCKELLFLADYNIISGITFEWKLHKKYYGHDNAVKEIAVESSSGVLLSTDRQGKIILHDLGTAEIIRVIIESAHYIFASELGVLITVKDSLLKIFSFDGRFLWESCLGSIKEHRVSNTGEYLAFTDSSSLGLFDIFENRVFFKGLSRVVHFSLAANENCIYLIKEKNSKTFLVILHV